MTRSDDILAQFVAAGAVHVETDVLQPAEVLLDLYGEDIRARAYVTQDPIMGEMMLRPDFTVPVVQRHMSNGAEPARYAYAGRVFRQQHETTKPREYSQVGFELFDRTNPARADAEVFTLIAKVLGNARALVGDIRILKAAVSGLTTTPARKAALMRHIWRPKRFCVLLDRFSGVEAMPDGRADMAKADPHCAPQIGLRSVAMVQDRQARLAQDAQADPIPASERAAIDAILTLKAGSRDALGHLSDIASGFNAISEAVAGFSERLAALEMGGVNVDKLAFEGSYGRMSMEYYDGFVFGFYRDDVQVASGGRYDALTAVLGRGQAIPAVGAVIRPELL